MIKEYFKNKSKRYLIVTIILSIICPILAVSYSNFIFSSDDYRASEMYIGSLLYGVKINGDATSSVVVPSGETEYVLEITSLNTVSSFYKLIYKTNENIEVKYNDEENDKPSGSISNTRTIKIYIINSSNEDIEVQFGVAAGYITNDLESVTIPDGYTEVKDFYETNDIKVVALYVNDSLVSSLDSGENYILKSYSCTNGETVTWNNDDRGIYITPVTTKTDCKLYFEINVSTAWYDNCSGSNTLRCAMLNNETAYADNVKSTYVSSSTGINFGAISSDTNGKGLYYTTDLTRTQDGERVYYYRGAVDNNYIVFANKCWRIVRTNEDGSVKLRYQGAASNNTCSSTAAPLTTMAFNTSYDDVAYSGYMYPNTPTTSSILNMSNDVVNANESNMKKYLDSWYDSNLASYESNIADTIYCADRTISSGTNYYNFTNTKNPYGKNVVFYGGFERLVAESTDSKWYSNPNAAPQYLCERTEDSFTKSSSIGNGKLEKAIGLITIDEAAYAGGLWYNTDGSSSNSSYYLYTGSWYWTMSPSYFDGTGASVFSVYTAGHLSYDHVYRTAGGVLPAVSLNASTTVASTGTGTASNPFVVE